MLTAYGRHCDKMLIEYKPCVSDTLSVQSELMIEFCGVKSLKAEQTLNIAQSGSLYVIMKPAPNQLHCYNGLSSVISIMIIAVLKTPNASNIVSILGGE